MSSRQKRHQPKQWWKTPKPCEVMQMRERLGLSQAEFSEVFGIEPRSLYNWERGMFAPQGITGLYLRMIEADAGLVQKLLTKIRNK